MVLGKGFKEMIDLIGLHGVERAFAVEVLKFSEQGKIAGSGSLLVV
jgi:hypothetical protein